MFSAASSVVVVVAVVWGFALVGSPRTTRLQRFDQQRLNDLQTIFREIQSLCRDPDMKDELKRPVPATLEELAKLARHERINLSDPETGQHRLHSQGRDDLRAECNVLPGTGVGRGGVLEPSVRRALLHCRYSRLARARVLAGSPLRAILAVIVGNPLWQFAAIFRNTRSCCGSSKSICYLLISP